MSAAISLSHSKRLWSHGFAALGVFVLCVMVGAAIGIGNIYIPLLILGMTGAIALLGMPKEFIYATLLLLVFLIVGQIEYFLGSKLGYWIPFLLAGALYLSAISVYFTTKSRPEPLQSWVPFFLLMFVICAIFSSLINKVPPIQLVVAVKNYLLFWGLMFFLALQCKDQRDFLKFWKWLLLLVPLQVPFAVYQHFFVAARRAATVGGGISWDAVVGSFGGNMDGGGASGAMGVFLCIALAASLAMYKNRLMSGAKLAGVVVCVLTTLLLAEVKFAFVLAPIAVLGVYYREVVRRPLFFLLLFTVIACVIAAFIFIYSALYWQGSSNGISVDQFIENLIAFNFSDNYFNRLTGEIGRFTLFSVWADEVGRSDIGKLLFGFGLGATRFSETMGGGGNIAMKYYPYVVNSTGASILLFETGVIGILSYCAILIAGIFRCIKLLRTDNPVQSTLATIGFVGLLIFLALLPYNHDTVDAVSVQFILMTILGYCLLPQSCFGQGDEILAQHR